MQNSVSIMSSSDIESWLDRNATVFTLHCVMYWHERLDHHPRPGNDLDWTPTHLFFRCEISGIAESTKPVFRSLANWGIADRIKP